MNLLKLLTNFEDKGRFVMGDMKGIQTIALGEKGLVSLCPMVTGMAIQNPDKGCCKNFAANISTSHGHQIKYIKPISRILTDECEPIICVEQHPMTLNLDKEISICQYKEGIRICESPEILSTGIDLTDIRFKTLKTNQSSVSKGFRFNSELQQLIYNTITSSNYHSAMMATLSYNALICRLMIYSVVQQKIWTLTSGRKYQDKATPGLSIGYLIHMLAQLCNGQ